MWRWECANVCVAVGQICKYGLNAYFNRQHKHMSILNRLIKRKTPPIQNYEDFWNWFRIHAHLFHRVIEEEGNVEKDFFHKLEPKLAELKEGYFYMTGMKDKTTAELIITADGTIKNFTFVEALIAAAPPIDGWEFTALKPSLDIKDVSIEMDGYKFSKSNQFFYSRDIPDYPDEIDLCFVHDEYTENNHQIEQGIFIFLDNFLGELDFASKIDNLSFSTKEKAVGSLIPIEKLKDYLNWREKEFIEKYEHAHFDSADEQYVLMEGKMSNGSVLIATINQTAITFDAKPSHPWILSFEISYDGKKTNGLPTDSVLSSLEAIESNLTDLFTGSDDTIYIGRQSADNLRSIFFACKEFRNPSRIAHTVQKNFEHLFQIDYDIYKDKYWRSFNQFLPKL